MSSKPSQISIELTALFSSIAKQVTQTREQHRNTENKYSVEKKEHQAFQAFLKTIVF